MVAHLNGVQGAAGSNPVSPTRQAGRGGLERGNASAPSLFCAGCCFSTVQPKQRKAAPGLNLVDRAAAVEVALTPVRAIPNFVQRPVRLAVVIYHTVIGLDFGDHGRDSRRGVIHERVLAAVRVHRDVLSASRNRSGRVVRQEPDPRASRTRTPPGSKGRKARNVWPYPRGRSHPSLHRPQSRRSAAGRRHPDRRAARGPLV